MQSIAIAFFFLIFAAGESGIINRQRHDSLTTNEALANHTNAIIETVLRNIHRMKNFEERDRLERLVTRFKILVQELELNAAAPIDGATDLQQNEDALDANRFSSDEKWKTEEEIFPKEKLNEVNPKTQYSNKLTDYLVKPKKMDQLTASFRKQNNKTRTTTAKPSLASPNMSTQQPTETTNINSTVEDDEDDDDELVQELHRKGSESTEENLATSSPHDELITVVDLHHGDGSDEDTIDDDLEDELLEMNDQQLQDDLKMLSKVIGKLREVKGLLRRLRGQGINRR